MFGWHLVVSELHFVAVIILGKLLVLGRFVPPSLYLIVVDHVHILDDLLALAGKPETISLFDDDLALISSLVASFLQGTQAYFL